MEKQYQPETTSAGNPQHRCPKTGTMMLISDLALLTDASFKKHVETYARDQNVFFADFKQAWIKLQENGCGTLRAAP
jgi:catalase (peroxidase I)